MQIIYLDKIMKKLTLYSLTLCCAFLMMVLFTRCTYRNPQLNATANSIVRDSVTQMAAHISLDVSTHGPAAWVNYFENDPGFFMASGGMLVFKDYATAKSYTLDTVVKNFKKISLSWKNVKVDPITAAYAGMSADFNEDIVLANGQNLSVSGYFTATAHFDGTRWRLRNMNWAIKQPEKPTH
jgi:hypothetical protein